MKYWLDQYDRIRPGCSKLLEFEIETVHTGRLIEIFVNKKRRPGHLIESFQQKEKTRLFNRDIFNKKKRPGR